MIDLDAYCARIGYDGPREPTLAVLRDIHLRHPAAIPFENIDPLLGRPVPLELAALEAKLVGGRRGGYCFEQNTLFKAVLEALGFQVIVLAARVRWMAPPDAPPNPRAHMVLQVALDDGPWIADVGFGGLLSAAPLRLKADIEQPTPAGPLRLRSDGMFFVLQAMVGEAWQDVYFFTLEPQVPIDIQVANWFTSTHPNSRFRNNLMMQRLLPSGRISLLNRRLVRRSDGRADERVLAGAADLAAALAEFGVAPPVAVDDLFGRLPA